MTISRRDLFALGAGGAAIAAGLAPAVVEASPVFVDIETSWPVVGRRIKEAEGYRTPIKWVNGLSISRDGKTTFYRYDDFNRAYEVVAETLHDRPLPRIEDFV